MVGSNGFRDDLAEYDYNESQDAGRNRKKPVSELHGRELRGQRGSRKINDIVADQNGRKHFCVLRFETENKLCGLLSGIRQRTHAHLIDGGQSRFRGRKECGKKKQNQDYRDNPLRVRV